MSIKLIGILDKSITYFSVLGSVVNNGLEVNGNACKTLWGFIIHYLWRKKKIIIIAHITNSTDPYRISNKKKIC